MQDHGDTLLIYIRNVELDIFDGRIILDIYNNVQSDKVSKFIDYLGLYPFSYDVMDHRTERTYIEGLYGMSEGGYYVFDHTVGTYVSKEYTHVTDGLSAPDNSIIVIITGFHSSEAIEEFVSGLTPDILFVVRELSNSSYKFYRGNSGAIMSLDKFNKWRGRYITDMLLSYSPNKLVKSARN